MSSQSSLGKSLQKACIMTAATLAVTVAGLSTSYALVKPTPTPKATATPTATPTPAATATPVPAPPAPTPIPTPADSLLTPFSQ